MTYSIEYSDEDGQAIHRLDGLERAAAFRKARRLSTKFPGAIVYVLHMADPRGHVAFAGGRIDHTDGEPI